MPTDFRDEKTFPRPGRAALGEYLWLARVFDKARASAAGTIHDYIYPCPVDQGVLERWGSSPEEFNQVIAIHRDDESILKWAQAAIPAERRAAANEWLVSERIENLDRQDREELAPVRTS